MWLLLSPLALARPSIVILGLDGHLEPDGLEEIAEMGGAVRACVADRVCTVSFEEEPSLTRLSALAGVRYARPDARMELTPTSAPAAADCPDLWELEAASAADAWSVAKGADAPLIAVQDSGFLTTHEDLSGRVNSQWDYGNGDPLAEIEWSSGVPSHGTFISGLIAAADNEVGRIGLAPAAQLYLQKIADDQGALYFSYAIEAMANLTTAGASRVRVLNYSIASSSWDEGFADAVAALEDAGVLVVAAAANCTRPDCPEADNDAEPVYPANLPGEHILSVANHERDGALSAYSHYGAETVDLAAPGTDLCSLDASAEDAYATASGTSYAAPLVAAAAALVFEVHPDLTPAEVAGVLRASAAPEAALEGWVRSGGRLDASRALSTAVPRLEPLADADPGAPLSVSLSNPGASGDGYLLLLHSPEISVRADGWSAQPLESGALLSIPGEAEIALEEAGTLLTGALPPGDTSISLEISGEISGRYSATARLIAVSAGEWSLSSPTAGTSDSTGQPAYPFAVEIEAPGAKDTGGEPAKGCICQGAAGGGWVWALSGLLSRRRPRRGLPAGAPSRG